MAIQFKYTARDSKSGDYYYLFDQPFNSTLKRKLDKLWATRQSNAKNNGDPLADIEITGNWIVLKCNHQSYHKRMKLLKDLGTAFQLV